MANRISDLEATSSAATVEELGAVMGDLLSLGEAETDLAHWLVTVLYNEDQITDDEEDAVRALLNDFSHQPTSKRLAVFMILQRAMLLAAAHHVDYRDL